MSPPHLSLRIAAITLAGLAAPMLATGVAVAEPPSQILVAPFTCGTQWQGGTRPGHGLNDWNLDINRTDRPPGDPDYDLGQPLLAQADGVVSWIGDHVKAGTYLDIDYGDITARYVHLVAGSIPAELAVGSTVTRGQRFGSLGDTGNATHAHLHLEYFDSRDLVDAAGWQIPDTDQIQITMAGEPIEPGEAFVSTNCDETAPPPPSSTTPPTSTVAPPTTTSAPHPFTDVDSDSYAYLDIALLHDIGLTTGTGPREYSPDATVTREQMAAFLARLWRLARPDDPPPDGPYPFDDIDPDSYARADIALLHDTGLTTGTGPREYSPDATVTREQMAAFLARLIRAAHLV